VSKESRKVVEDKGVNRLDFRTKGRPEATYPKAIIDQMQFIAIGIENTPTKKTMPMNPIYSSGLWDFLQFLL